MALGGGAFWGGGLGHAGGALGNGISDESSLALSTMCVYRERTAVCEPGSRCSPEAKSVHTMILDLSAFRTVRNRWLLCLSQPVDGVLEQKTEPTKTTQL